MNAGRLGVQIHCLRRRLAQDFPGVLAEIASLGVEGVELVSFPGCRGNPWGDFGALADWTPEEIRATLGDANLQCPSSHVAWRELDEASFGTTIQWLQGVGVSRAVLGSVPVRPDAGLDEWLRIFDRFNALGERVQRCGLEFAYHTQTDLWRPTNGVRPADELLRRIDARLCQIEYDPSGALMYGANLEAYLQARPEAFWALHLRDGVRPAEPAPYFPALALGDGQIDFDTLLAAARASSIEWRFIEMEVAPEHAVMPAIRKSCAYLSERIEID